MNALRKAYVGIFREGPPFWLSHNELAELVVEGGIGSALLPPGLILECRTEIMGDPSLSVQIRDWAKHKLFPAAPQAESAA